ncbi:hypothetical protein J2S22_003167 [Rhodoplanes tepidamans]|nr:hypothetical protein [Rhodoplanes tepidamans]
MEEVAPRARALPASRGVRAGGTVTGRERGA